MSISPVRVVAGTAAGALVATLLTVTLTSVPTATAAPAADRAKVTYRATITRTEHGIPHVVANDYGSLGFGAGYSAAETSICTLADVVLTARAQRSRHLGPNGRYDDGVAMNGTNLQADALVTDIRNRKVVEKLLRTPDAAPGQQTRAMVRGYAAGVNKYLRSIGGSKNITDPKCRGAAWIRPNATAMDIWYGVYLANILASTGNFLKQIVDADPPSLTDPGLPDLATFGLVPANLPNPQELLKNLGKGKTPFGSNATAVGRSSTSTKRGMILGNPHFPWNGRYRFTQQHLTIPGKYDVAGASLIGSPVVNIGWNKNVAWSHTVSTAYRFTPYEYRTVGLPTTYLSADGLFKQLERREVKVVVKNPDGSLKTVTEDMYRTKQGYVIDDPATLMGWTPLSFFAIRDANGEQLRTVDTFFEMGKATNVRDLIARQDKQGGMPWVNTTAADRAGNVLYADHSVVPNVSNKLANKCMTPIGRITNQLAGLPGLDGTTADTICKWGTDADAARPGILGPRNLPKTVRTDWVMNANDSYWLPNPKQKLEGYARIIGCEKCERTMRSRMVYGYPADTLKQRKVTPAALRGWQHKNRVKAAEVMGTAALVAVCEAADGGNACPVLARWDKHSNINSRGTHIFEEFVKRLPTPGLLPTPSIWKVPFDAADPVRTPRGLKTGSGAVVTAMKDGIASLRSRKIPMNARWGAVQVAADRGAPAIPLGGGSGDDAGNANALASRNPDTNKGFGKPVTYGSSHIQGISFLDGGKVDARTILTYGQSDNPRSPWSKDQTWLFSRKQWVLFPFTPAQIADQRISRVTITW